MFLIKKHKSNDGISCVVRHRNEKDWVCLSILSIVDFADEIIFVDNESDDGSYEDVLQLKKDFDIDKLKIFTYPKIDHINHSYTSLSNFAISKVTKSWMFKWDADFLARTNQRHSILELKELWAKNKDKYERFDLCGMNLFGDHKHFFDEPEWRNQAYCFEPYLWKVEGFTYVQGERYEVGKWKNGTKVLSLGPYNKPDDTRVYFFHMQGLKPDNDIVERKTRSFWWEYCLKNPTNRKTYRQWAADFWGTESVEEQTDKCMQEILGKLTKQTNLGGEWGYYPSLSYSYLQNPKYEIIYKDGKPARRETLW